jgi:hypothetical protein
MNDTHTHVHEPDNFQISASHTIKGSHETEQGRRIQRGLEQAKGDDINAIPLAAMICFFNKVFAVPHLHLWGSASLQTEKPGVMLRKAEIICYKSG